MIAHLKVAKLTAFSNETILFRTSGHYCARLSQLEFILVYYTQGDLSNEISLTFSYFCSCNKLGSLYGFAI